MKFSCSPCAHVIYRYSSFFPQYNNMLLYGTLKIVLRCECEREWLFVYMNSAIGWQLVHCVKAKEDKGWIVTFVLSFIDITSIQYKAINDLKIYLSIYLSTKHISKDFISYGFAGCSQPLARRQQCSPSTLSEFYQANSVFPLTF